MIKLAWVTTAAAHENLRQICHVVFVVSLYPGGSPHNLSFRVKFFVTDPSKLQEEYTR